MGQTSLVERTSDFIDSVGVNTHLDTQKNSVASITSDLEYLGLDHIRNASINANSSRFFLRDMGYLADAGLAIDFTTRADIGGTIDAVNTFLSQHTNAVASIEGPNEVNNFPTTYNGLTGSAAAVAYQDALYAAVRADPTLRGIPVLNFTDNPYVAAQSDGSNFHPYPGQGSQPLATLSRDVSRAKSVAPGLPVYFTEAGYSTAPDLPGGAGVDSLTQAKLTLNLIFDSARLGVATTYLYDLLDEGSDPTAAIDHFGLFSIANAPKPSAQAIHNLTSILVDPGKQAKTFTATALNYSIVGLPADGYSLALETSNGAHDIAVWAEPTIWNAQTHQPIPALASSITLKLGATFDSVRLYDPLASTSPVSTWSGVDSVTFAVADHPIILQVANLASAISSFVPNVAAALTSTTVAQTAVTPISLAARVI